MAEIDVHRALFFYFQLLGDLDVIADLLALVMLT